MLRKSSVLFVVLIAVSCLFAGAAFAARSFGEGQENANSSQDQTRRKLHVPQRRHRTGQDVLRNRHRGIGHAYKYAGKSAGRGGKRFGRNVGHGRPLRGGKEFGKGMGGFGKGVGQGTGRTGKKVGTTIKHAVTP